MTTKALLAEIKNSNQDFEWYPTTDEIINIIKADIDEEWHNSPGSILDCGAGDGRVLEALGNEVSKMYAIEKSKPLLNAMSKEVFIVGTEFEHQTLLDKNVDITFSNPPYSQFKQWAMKIIKESRSSFVYLVIPSRWSEDKDIADAIEDREATSTVIGSTDFFAADRAARAKVDIVKIDLENAGRFSRHSFRSSRRYGSSTDPFSQWFNENFKIKAPQKETSDYAKSASARNDLKETINGLVEGDNLIATLERLYMLDMENLTKNYQKIGELDPGLLKEMDVNLDSVKGSLKSKIEGLKNLYWNELFNNLRKITDKLTNDSRKKMLEVLTKHTHVDFTASNAYAIVIWAIKNANSYFDSQLIDLVETMTEKENVASYVSNRKTFGEDGWYYGRATEKLIKYKLEHRCIMSRCGGIHTPEWYQKNENGLQERAYLFLEDIRTIATNIGFDTSAQPKINTLEWHSGKKHILYYDDLALGRELPLMEVKAFKKGTIHIKFNQAFMCKLNVEFGRLKGWLKTPRGAAEELDIDIEQASQSFKSNLQLSSDKFIALEYKEVA